MSVNLAILLYIVTATLLVILAMVLIKRGWWPRRTGADPRCRACNYLLIGLESDKCPECGVRLSPQNILRGQRRRRPGTAAGGVLLLLLVIGLSVPATFSALDHFDWYHYEPTFLVLGDLKSTSVAASLRAMAELKRREAANEISTRYEQEIADFALAQQASSASGTLKTNLIEFVGDEYIAGKLIPAEKLLFTHQSGYAILRVRPRILKGDRVPYEVDYHSRTEGRRWWLQFQVGETLLDKPPAADAGFGPGESSMTGWGAGGSTSSNIQCDAIGKHQLFIPYRMRLRTGNFGKSDPVIYQEDRVLSCPFEVVTQPAAEDKPVAGDPKLDAAIKASLQPSEIAITHDGLIDVTLDIKNVPANVAFQISVRLATSDQQLGGIACPRGTTTSWSLTGSNIKIDRTNLPTTCDLILNSDEKLGRESVDIHGIWTGTLIYPNQPLKYNN